jgi:hypothetical protein
MHMTYHNWTKICKSPKQTYNIYLKLMSSKMFPNKEKPRSDLIPAEI